MKFAKSRYQIFVLVIMSSVGFFLQAKSYEIPSMATVVEYDISQMTEATYQCRSEECAAWQTYLKGMDRFRQERLRDFYDINKVKTVFYPASGSDGVLPWLLFPHTKEVIALDCHLFVPNEVFKQNASLPIYKPKGMAWRLSTHIDGENMAAYLIAGLRGAFPDIKFKSIKAFKFSGSKGINGLIEFQLGLSRETRQFLFLNDDIPWKDSSNKFKESRWYKWLSSQSVNAIIIKSAADAFLPQGVRKIYGPGHPVLREDMKRWLAKSHGLMVEGRSQYGDSFEFTPSSARHYGVLSKRCDLSLWRPKLGTAMSGTVYGYGSEVLLTRY